MPDDIIVDDSDVEDFTSPKEKISKEEEEKTMKKIEELVDSL